jgi:hypothetical protein
LVLGGTGTASGKWKGASTRGGNSPKDMVLLFTRPMGYGIDINMDHTVWFSQNGSVLVKYDFERD